MIQNDLPSLDQHEREGSAESLGTTVSESTPSSIEAAEGREKQTHATKLRGIAVRGGLLLVATRLGLQAVTWLSTIQVTRLLGTMDYAVLTTGLIVVGLCDLLAEAGVGRALVYRDQLSDDEVNETFTLSVLISSTIYAILFLLSGWIVGFFDLPSDAALYLRVVAVIVLVVPLRMISYALVERKLDFKQKSIVYLLSNVLQSLLLVALVSGGMGYWAFAVSTLLGRFVETTMLLRSSGWRPSFRGLTHNSRDILFFGLNVSAASLLWFACSNSDFAVVGRVTGAISLGYYGLAFQLITIPVQKLTTAFNNIAFPVFCRMQNDPTRVRSWYLRLLGLLGFFGLPAMVGMALVAKDAFRVILGEKWLPAVTAFQIMSTAGAVMMISATLTSVFVAIGRPDIELKYNATCTVLLPVCFYVAARFYGMIGVCLVWALIYPLIIACLVHITKPLTGFGLRDMLLTLRPVFVGLAAMILTVLGVQYLLGDFGGPTIRLIIEVLSGAMVYAGYHLLVDRQTYSDLRIIMREVRGKGASPQPQPA